MILSKVERVFREHGLLENQKDRVLCACSGGVDSIVLLYASAHVLGNARVACGHVDHGVRKEASEKDAKFVEEFARALGVSFFSERLSGTEKDEASLREKRYAALKRQKNAAGARYLLTAHHEDDQAETFLIGLFRGGGAAALKGIPVFEAEILRPLLEATKKEIQKYARSQGLEFREDETNREPRYLRNRIRKEILPLLESRYRPNVRAHLAAVAAELRQGKTFDFQPKTPGEELNRSAPKTVSYVDEPGISVAKRPWFGEEFPSHNRIAFFDAANLNDFVLRPAKTSDRIRPFGSIGTRKLQDVFVDAKVEKDRRSRIWVVATLEGEVLWVPGLLRSALCPVGTLTKEVWVFEQRESATCEAAPKRSV